MSAMVTLQLETNLSELRHQMVRVSNQDAAWLTLSESMDTSAKSA
jgi:hypothetical protein